MKIYLKNIGKIKDDEIKINGITVIAGENNTGKSTIGKSLFSVFNGFYNIEEKLREEKKKSIFESIHKNLGRRVHFSFRRNTIIEEFDEYYDKIDQIFDESRVNTYDDLERDECTKQILNSYINSVDIDKYDDENVIETFEAEKVLEHIKKIYSVSNEEYIKHILEDILNTEFNGQINNIYLEDTGTISLIIKNQELKVFIEDNEVTQIKNIIPIKTEAVYIDDPFLLDEYLPFRFRYLDKTYPLSHRQHLQSKLFYRLDNDRIIDGIVNERKFERILNMLSSVCDGDFEIKGTRALYKEKNREGALDVKNLSAGLKTFVILKKLLEDNVIEDNGTIILDEPEVHLHPEWQLIFAELIVLIQKEFNMHILLTTHSPYFLNAIEVYTHKYRINENCNYYIAYNEGNFSRIKDCTDNIEVIYSKLARPLQELESERYDYE